jgi:hypothetical protein
MAAQKVPGTGHDGWGGGAPRNGHPRAQEPPAVGNEESGLRLTLIEKPAPSVSTSGEPKGGEAISLGGYRQVLVILGILAAGLLLAFLIRMLAL